jgi:hypothetical protein
MKYCEYAPRFIIRFVKNRNRHLILKVGESNQELCKVNLTDAIEAKGVLGELRQQNLSLKACQVIWDTYKKLLLSRINQIYFITEDLFVNHFTLQLIIKYNEIKSCAELIS